MEKVAAAHEKVIIEMREMKAALEAVWVRRRDLEKKEVELDNQWEEEELTGDVKAVLLRLKIVDKGTVWDNNAGD